MKEIKEKMFKGERSLFGSQDLEISYSTFADGESPLKESSNLKLKNDLFKWKYPLWYSDKVEIENSTLFEMARAGIWYSNDITIKNSTIRAPKTFRRSSDIKLENVTIPEAEETLWNCDRIKLDNVTAKGDYFAMNSNDLDIKNFDLVGNYSFDSCKNIEIRNAKMLSKDAFWNCEDVTVYDSFISGEYIAWNSKNITFVNCTIESLQGFCYVENLKLENCRLLNTNLAFEYSTVEVDVSTKIESIKNPLGGTIKAKAIGEVIMDEKEIDPEKTEIITADKGNFKEEIELDILEGVKV
ncbi:DUF3737 family protein [Halanaerobium kushneri]|uniref:DUF3737 domain-containing protein n=1 Tax=Halanaerobium kushneri TaxID=56779 RepID=A0A1N6WRE7_9FIRM|nr:DUF3737 family protein [Halanaerobium kushneri]SIQ92611.1 Protein of unknown function [Halanaerobium kushneri]